MREEPGPTLRDPVLDALRTLAVLLMIASHTTRLIAWDERRDWSRWSLIIEPFTASLFLILVGASLVQSREKARRSGAAPPAWLRRQAIRAGALWALSIVFYTVSEGFQFPDAIFLSGILCTIAYTSLAGSLLLITPRPALSLALLAGAMTSAYVWLDLRELRLFVLSAGNSPLLPLSLFGVLGALATLGLATRRRWLNALLVAAAVAAMAVLLSRHSFVAIFTKPLGRYETARVFTKHQAAPAGEDTGSAGERTGPAGEKEATGVPGAPPAVAAKVEKTIPYYNLRLLLFPAILSLTVLIYALLAAMRPIFRRGGSYPASGPAAWLFRLGRRSLDVYILHLALLAILVTVGGKRPLKETWQGDAVYLGVIALCYLWVWGRDIQAARRRPASPAGRNTP